MTEARVNRFVEIQWWPSPTHFAIMLQIARDTYRDIDPSAPPECENMIRVRTAQIDISETLNVTPKTVRKVFADFRVMRVMRPADGSRTWYLNKRVDDTTAFAKHMLDWWPKMQENRHRDGDAPANGTPPEVEWYELLESPEGDAPAAPRPPRRLDAILHPTTPPPMRVRLESAIVSAATDLSLDPTDVEGWWRAQWDSIEALAEMLDASEYATVREWIEDHLNQIHAATSDPMTAVSR